jgi:hypothetical protein
MYVARTRSSYRLAMSKRWLAKVVSSSDVAIYELKMAGWIGKELRNVWLLAKS